MKLTLIFETDDSSVMRAVSTATAMIAGTATDATTDPPTFALGDALTTTAWLVEVLGETIDDHRKAGIALQSCATVDFRERLARQLRSLATLLLDPPLPDERNDERLTEAHQKLNDALADGISPAVAERRFEYGMDWIDEGHDLFDDAIPA